MPPLMLGFGFAPFLVVPCCSLPITLIVRRLAHVLANRRGLVGRFRTGLHRRGDDFSFEFMGRGQAETLGMSRERLIHVDREVLRAGCCEAERDSHAAKEA